MKFIGVGILEYDKRKAKPLRACAKCGCGIARSKKFCGPCYDLRLEETTARNRGKYRARAKERN